MRLYFFRDEDAGGKTESSLLAHLLKYTNNVIFRLRKIQIMELNTSLYQLFC